MVLTKETSIVLNLIRGLSAQLVLIGHLLSLYDVYGNEPGDVVVQNFGVTIFFLLSGFLICYSVASKNAAYGFRDFFIDRFSRIYIAYLPALLLILGIDLIGSALFQQYPYQEHTTLKHFLANVFMLQDFAFLKHANQIWDLPWLFVSSFGTGRPLWTVGIEWWTYLLFGAVLYLKLNARTLLFFLFLSIVPLYSVISGSNALVLVWLMGALIFVVLKYFQEITLNHKALLLIFSVLMVARLHTVDYYMYDVVFSFLLGAILYVLLSMLQKKRIENKSHIFFAMLSEKLASFSFSLYLLHYTLNIFFLQLKLNIDIWAQILICFFLSNMIAYSFASLTEFRYHRFRNWIKRKTDNRQVSKNEVAVQN